MLKKEYTLYVSLVWVLVAFWKLENSGQAPAAAALGAIYFLLFAAFHQGQDRGKE